MCVNQKESFNNMSTQHMTIKKFIRASIAVLFATGTVHAATYTYYFDANSSTVGSGAFFGGNGSYGGNITLNNGANLGCEMNLADSTLTCNGQLGFTNLNFTNCTFTVASGAGYPPYRRIPLIEAASLGTTTFANTEGAIAGVPAKLYLKGKILMLDVGYTPGTLISIF